MSHEQAMPIGAATTRAVGPAVEHDVALPVRAVGGRVHVSAGARFSARGYKSGEDTATAVERALVERIGAGGPGAQRVAEITWLVTLSVGGGWLAEQLVPTRESALLGAVVSLYWAHRKWRQLMP